VERRCAEHRDAARLAQRGGGTHFSAGSQRSTSARPRVPVSTSRLAASAFKGGLNEIGKVEFKKRDAKKSLGGRHVALAQPAVGASCQGD